MAAYDLEARDTAAIALAPVSQGGFGQVVQITRGGVAEFQTGSGLEQTYSASSIDGTLILAGDKLFLLSPFNIAGVPITPPEPDLDRIQFADGSTWQIKRVDPLSPAGTVIMFTLQLRSSG